MKPPDWEAIERDYRANVKSLRNIGAEYGVSHAGIMKRAKKEGWTRDLSAKIKAATLSLVNNAAVSTLPVSSGVTAEKALSDKTVIEANAELQKQLILAHRADIKRGRAVTLALLSELEEITGNNALFEELGEAMRDPEAGKDRRNEIYSAVIGLHGRVDTAKKLADTMRIFVGLEREAFGIESKSDLDDLTRARSMEVAFVPVRAA